MLQLVFWHFVVPYADREGSLTLQSMAQSEKALQVTLLADNTKTGIERDAEEMFVVVGVGVFFVFFLTNAK